MCFAYPFAVFLRLCKGVTHSAAVCGIQLLLALKMCIHLRSSHSTDVQRQNHVTEEDAVIHPFLKNDSERKLHALK